MATRKVPKYLEAKKDAKTEAQLLIQATVNSTYSLLIPCKSEEFIYVRNPVTGKISHFEIKKPNFLECIKELTTLGLGEKLEKDFEDLVHNNNSNWVKVLDQLHESNAFKLEQL
jgi:hypothetical protein